jgi:hypothetical protein
LRAPHVKNRRLAAFAAHCHALPFSGCWNNTHIVLGADAAKDLIDSVDLIVLATPLN